MIVEKGPDTVEKVFMWLAMGAVVLLGVVLMQPIWRGDEMVAEMRVNCDKIGGVMLENKGMFGITYECSPRYDRGVK